MRVLKKLGYVVLLIGIYFVAQAAVTMLFGLVGGIANIVAGYLLGGASDGAEQARRLIEFLNAALPLISLTAIAVAVPVYLLVYRKKRPELRQLCSFRLIGAAEAGGLIVFSLGFGILLEYALSLLSRVDALSGVFRNYGELTKVLSAGGFVLSLAVTGVLVPFFEEFLFRGLVFGELKKVTGVRTALFAQALLFGISHFNTVQSTYAFAVGLVLGCVYLKSGSLLAPIIIHTVINSGNLIAAHFLSDDLYTRLSGYLPAVGAALILASALLLLMDKHRESPARFDKNG